MNKLLFFEKKLIVQYKDFLNNIYREQATLTGRPTASGKSHFGPDSNLLGPNLGYKIFFGGFRSTRRQTLFQVAIPCNIKENNDANLIKWQKKTISATILGPQNFFGSLTLFQAIIVCNFKGNL